ncbi:hypothetical protein AUP68_07532 [Ilyonectria robusta]
MTPVTLQWQVYHEDALASRSEDSFLTSEAHQRGSAPIPRFEASLLRGLTTLKHSATISQPSSRVNTHLTIRIRGVMNIILASSHGEAPTTPISPEWHQPLPTPRSIRVLRLHPDPSRDSALKCSLVPVSLDDSPKYWALSYTWDAQAPSHPIICQVDAAIRRLNITPNCTAALRQLRDAAEERTLWVDSICIDQTSLEERSSQVALMGDIYLGAEQVVVWLGESDPPTNQAIDLLKRIGDFSVAKSIHKDTSIDLEARKRAQELIHANARELTKGGRPISSSPRQVYRRAVISVATFGILVRGADHGLPNTAQLCLSNGGNTSPKPDIYPEPICPFFVASEWEHAEGVEVFLVRHDVDVGSVDRKD